MRKPIFSRFCAFRRCRFRPRGDGGYKLVPNWVKLPPGMFFGLKDAPPPGRTRRAGRGSPRAGQRAPTPCRALQANAGLTNRPASRVSHRQRRSHLCLQPRRQAGGVRHGRQPDQRAPTRKLTARPSTRRGTRAASIGTATSMSSSATRTASSSSVPRWTSSCCSWGRPA